MDRLQGRQCTGSVEEPYVYPSTIIVRSRYLFRWFCLYGKACHSDPADCSQRLLKGTMHSGACQTGDATARPSGFHQYGVPSPVRIQSAIVIRGVQPFRCFSCCSLPIISRTSVRVLVLMLTSERLTLLTWPVDRGAEKSRRAVGDGPRGYGMADVALA